MPQKGSVTPEVPVVVMPPLPKAICDWKTREKLEKKQKHDKIVESEVLVSVPNLLPLKRKEEHVVELVNIYYSLFYCLCVGTYFPL